MRVHTLYVPYINDGVQTIRQSPQCFFVYTNSLKKYKKIIKMMTDDPLQEYRHGDDKVDGYSFIFVFVICSA